jgi:hypothetical protein
VKNVTDCPLFVHRLASRAVVALFGEHSLLVCDDVRCVTKGRANVGLCETRVEISSSYGQPTQNLSTSYLPRVWQLAFRLSF